MEENEVMNNEEALTEVSESSNGWTPLEVAVLAAAGYGAFSLVKNVIVPTAKSAGGMILGVFRKKDKKVKETSEEKESVETKEE